MDDVGAAPDPCPLTSPATLTALIEHTLTNERRGDF
jgi:hypothetical protein